MRAGGVSTREQERVRLHPADEGKSNVGSPLRRSMVDGERNDLEIVLEIVDWSD